MARTRPCWLPDLGLPASGSVRNQFPLFEPPGLQCSVLMARAKAAGDMSETRLARLECSHLTAKPFPAQKPTVAREEEEGSGT